MGLEKLPDHRAEYMEAIGRGIIPTVGGGFSFVLDRRPAGHNKDPIPAVEYTRSFRRQEIPIAAPGQGYHYHDSGHIQSYRWLFGAAAMGVIAQQAAEQADNLGLHDYFAYTMDRLGDSASVAIDTPPYSAERPAVRGVSRHVAELSHLALTGAALTLTLDNQPETVRDFNELTRSVHDDLDLIGRHARGSEHALSPYGSTDGGVYSVPALTYVFVPDPTY